MKINLTMDESQTLLLSLALRESMRAAKKICKEQGWCPYHEQKAAALAALLAHVDKTEVESRLCVAVVRHLFDNQYDSESCTRSTATPWLYHGGMRASLTAATYSKGSVESIVLTVRAVGAITRRQVEELFGFKLIWEPA